MSASSHRTALALTSLLFFASSVGLAETLKVSKSAVEASSTYPGDADVSYSASNIVDNKQSTVWVEGDEGSGLGSWVELDLGGAQNVSGLRIWNGNWYTYDFWQRHNRVKNLQVELDDGTKLDFELKDEFAPELITFDKAISASKIKLRIKGIYSGSTFNDTCLSEIQVIDTQPIAAVPVKAWSVSSTYPADNDGNYEPTNLTDGLYDSMWCEGDPGDGAGQWVEADFGGPRQVSKLKVLNGNGYSLGFNLKANRVKTATLSFSDGSKEQIELRTSLVEQEISFSPRTTSKVRITFDEVVAGKEFNDLCLSEAKFVP